MAPNRRTRIATELASVSPFANDSQPLGGSGGVGWLTHHILQLMVTMVLKFPAVCAAFDVRVSLTVLGPCMDNVPTVAGKPFDEALTPDRFAVAMLRIA